MLPVITIAGLAIPTYVLCSTTGLILVVLFALKRGRRLGMPIRTLINLLIYVSAFLVLGSKILIFLTRLPIILSKPEYFAEAPLRTLNYAFSGYVFYGGLIGALFALFLFSRYYEYEFSFIAGNFLPAFPLFHAFGRLGCLLSGCCYGILYKGPLAIIYPDDSLYTDPLIAGTSRFPTQCVEILYNVIFFIILYICNKKNADGRRLTGLYLASYSFMRFILEFLRGDEIRGVWLGLSTSQWIAAVLFPIGLYLLLRRNTQNICNA